jgi:Flp pilus assembly protein TadB
MMRHLDRGSLIVVLITFLLFVGAVFAKGLSHDLLLEAGVFLVSVKLIMMAYKHSVANREVLDRLDQMQNALARLEQGANAAKASNQAMQPTADPRTASVSDD